MFYYIKTHIQENGYFAFILAAHLHAGFNYTIYIRINISDYQQSSESLGVFSVYRNCCSAEDTVLFK